MAEATALRDGKYIFQLLNKISPRSQNEPPYQRKKVLKDRSLVKDSTTQKNRFLRYIPGASSMWLDEQDKMDQTYAAMNAWQPVFENGTLILSYPEDAEKINVMMLRDEYDGKDSRISKASPMYTLVNKEQEYKNDLEFEKKKHEAVGIALTAEWPEFKDHAIFLGVAVTANGQDRAETEVRGDYVSKATTNPALFLKSANSPVANITGQVKEFIRLGMVDFTHMKGQAHYTESKGLIMVLDPAKDNIEQLVGFALGDKGKDFRNRLNKLNKK